MSTHLLRRKSLTATPAVVKAVGWVTFSEIIRDKVLYNVILCAGLLLSIGFLASRLSFIRPERIILDFGLTSVTVSCAMIAIFTGAGLLNKEFERRTIYVALCHPITRAQFLLGKFAGLALIILINWMALSSAYLLILGFTSQDTSCFSPSLGMALLLTLVQTWIIASMTLFFSAFSTASLSAIMTIGLYLIGQNITQIEQVAKKLETSFGKTLLTALSVLLPNLEHFNIGFKATYGLPISVQSTVLSFIYGLVLIGLFLFAAGTAIGTKEL